MGKTEIMMSMIKGRSFQVPAVMISLASEQDFIANVNLKNKTVTYFFTSKMGLFVSSNTGQTSYGKTTNLSGGQRGGGSFIKERGRLF